MKIKAKSFEALSCFVSKSFPSKSNKNSLPKNKKADVTPRCTPPPPECHVLFEWPLIENKT